MKDARYSLLELEAASGVPARTIRFYIQRGLVDRPEGEKRGAYYPTRQLEQLVRIKKWSEEGISLERIAELLAGGAPPRFAPRPGTIDVRTHIHLRPGLSLVVSPDEARLTQVQLRALVRAVLKAADRTLGADHEDER